ncbi:MAG TPA: sigma-70 family RNA polymerase sigma factor [Tepidisphaeraceae bacterium]|jgi:RNA polymerase sigma-70 factor (ECF subfamily)|nr:sigma-70 family RNA polymerase sigma factor [Tepidisphaeraceae bacterium]
MPRELSQDQWIRSAVLQFEAPLTLYAARILGDLDRARDVVQETFLRLCRQNHSEVSPHLLEWLYSVCRNRALDLLRRQRTRRTSLLAPTVACRIAPPAKLIEDRDLAARIIGMLDTLPDNQRAVITLKFQNGLSYKQISRQTGLSVSNVGFLIHTALKTLRRALEVPQ